MRKYWLLKVLFITVCSNCVIWGNDLSWTAQEKYAFAGTIYDHSEQCFHPYVDIYTGDFPLILQWEPRKVNIFTGLPLNRPTPFFVSGGTENQVGFIDAYSKVALLQSGSIGFQWDLFGDQSIDKFITLGSRINSLSAGLRFYENSKRLLAHIQHSTEYMDLYSSIEYTIPDQELSDWSIGIDLRNSDTCSVRLEIARDLSISLAVGISHHDPPADLVRDLEWDYVGAHRGDLIKFPENSREGFNYAISRDDISFIETDMNATSDGGYVAIHDTNIFRYSGTFKPVHDMSMAEIKQVDAGSFFSREYAHDRFLDMHELAETLSPFASRGFVMLEVKLIGKGPEAMEKFLAAVRETVEPRIDVSYMTLYYDNAELLEDMILEDENWGLCFLSSPGLPPFVLFSGFIYPLFKEEITRVVHKYHPSYIILTTEFIEYYDKCRDLAEELGIDILFWDFKDTIYGISSTGEDYPSFMK